MLKIYKILPVGFASNAYLLTKDGKNAVAIDPSQPRVIKKAEALGLKITAVLLTHGHFDHVGACFSLSEEGVPIYCAEKEKDLVNGENSMYYAYGAPAPTFKTQATLKEGDTITLASIDFAVIETPGHTAGSVTYRVEDNLFTGDTLFEESVGRTDLPTGDWGELQKSVKKLYALQGDFNIYAGHGDDTTLDRERKYNSYIRA